MDDIDNKILELDKQKSDLDKKILELKIAKLEKDKNDMEKQINDHRVKLNKMNTQIPISHKTNYSFHETKNRNLMPLYSEKISSFYDKPDPSRYGPNASG